MKYFHSQNIQNVRIERDSLVLKIIIKESWKILWKIVESIQEIKEIMSSLNITIKHIYRKGNALTDYLANIALKE